MIASELIKVLDGHQGARVMVIGPDGGLKEVEFILDGETPDQEEAEGDTVYSILLGYGSLAEVPAPWPPAAMAESDAEEEPASKPEGVIGQIKGLKFAPGAKPGELLGEGE